jgi:hypothetical protein
MELGGKLLVLMKEIRIYIKNISYINFAHYVKTGKLNWIENVLGKDDSSFDKLFVFNTALSSEEALSSYMNF